jgi:DNA end-binding protein Ku
MERRDQLRLVNIPVELYSAEDKKSFKFAMLDKRDFSPVGYKRYSKKSKKEVEWSDIVKGYEYEKGQYVVLSDEDFKRANVKATQTIDIQCFVGEDEVPVEYFETPYFLAPAARGQKVYALLRETLQASKRIAIAQVVIRTTQHLAAIVVKDRALMLNTLRYHDELVDPKALDLPAEGLKAAGVSAKEVQLAKRLIDDMTEHWKPKNSRTRTMRTSWRGSRKRSSSDKRRKSRSPTRTRKRGRDWRRSWISPPCCARALPRRAAMGSEVALTQDGGRRARSQSCAWSRANAPPPRRRPGASAPSVARSTGRSPWDWKPIGPSAIFT